MSPGVDTRTRRGDPAHHWPNTRPRPYLFIGAVARYTGRPDYECVRAFAQPIVATDCPIPVDSRNERFALGQLRTTVDILSREFPGAQFSITKPLFPIETQIDDQTRYCLPDFLLRIARGSTSLLFVIEVMGFDRPSYLQSKAATHPIMATLGTLLEMDATRFHEGPAHRTQQGRRLTEALRGILRQSSP